MIEWMNKPHCATCRHLLLGTPRTGWGRCPVIGQEWQMWERYSQVRCDPVRWEKKDGMVH